MTIPLGEEPAKKAGYTPHIRRVGYRKKDEAGEKTHPARRWVVERTFAWLSRWRGILIRWDKKPSNYLATCKLACALLWFRKLHVLKQEVILPVAEPLLFFEINSYPCLQFDLYIFYYHVQSGIYGHLGLLCRT